MVMLRELQVEINVNDWPIDIVKRNGKAAVVATKDIKRGKLVIPPHATRTLKIVRRKQHPFASKISVTYTTRVQSTTQAADEGERKAECDGGPGQPATDAGGAGAQAPSPSLTSEMPHDGTQPKDNAGEQVRVTDTLTLANTDDDKEKKRVEFRQFSSCRHCPGERHAVSVSGR